ERYYIDRVVCDNGLPEVVEPRLVRALVEEGVGIARFESNAAGGRVADDVKRGCSEAGHSIDMRKVYSTENKETRILVDSMWVKEHCLFRSDDPSADYKRVMSMLTHYTTEGKNKHDDAPDAMSMLKRYATSLTRARVEAVRRIA
ncbi:MAG: phage terminase large subunit, partial [Atopobiaceae bacterium]|nr:phage terminase large subunit [Atopobiaceae bacterium]